MNAESLLTSASINIGFALLILTLFSILRNSPSNAPIYYARRLSQHRRLSFLLRRFLPSVEWIRLSLSVTDDEILDTSGLDVLIFIRLFKFGINFFLVCSVIGLLLLLPLNYIAGEGGPSRRSHSMDAFTISNIANGSHWLWVHFLCLHFVSCYGLYLLYKEYKDILVKRINQLHIMRHQPNQFTVLVREIPLCDEHKARDCAVDHFFSKYHPHSYKSFQILYDGKELDKLLVTFASLLFFIFMFLINEAKSITRKIEDLRHRSMTKQNRVAPHAEIEQLKEILEELGRRIRNTQTKEQLQSKRSYFRVLFNISCLGFLQELPVAFITFKSRWGAALAAQSQQTSNPLLWITEIAPEPRDVLWNNLSIKYKYLPLHKFGVYVAASLLTIFFAVPVTAVQGIAKFERLTKWFPPAMAVQLIPGLRSIVTGYIPSVILNSFVYIVPFAMMGMANLGGYVSRSRKDIKACNLVFYFLVGNVFFLSLLSGSLLDQIGESFSHPRDFPSRLASAASAQADFFMTYILTNGLSGFSLEILQPGLLIWDTIKSHTWDREKKKRPYLYSLPYYRIIPFVALCILIGMVYAVVSPLLLPFLVGYFCLGYVVFVNQIRDVYITTYETCGQYWPYIHHYIVVAIVIMQITMIGLFGLKSKPLAAFSTIPLVVFTLLFNEYCKIRFLPTFYQCSVKVKCVFSFLISRGSYISNLENAIDAYSPPCLRAPDIDDVESGSLEPLISPT
ncbi:PREDICTED: CSC1-like protein At3g54510 [Erythranthe guttata]|uniref:CSC1-like protein At3g54510 n=1 Tax=Erythranthe guttata TaxID=4155 RepID=UPI00064DD558|nr:PREDICTED: CSC1-like protein At3g54510 [Erythranthe guttata]|eukprot:XP_012836367.1 PREDICTED: CSC1-like protein At3g54510 [Erythranthe guttata]